MAGAYDMVREQRIRELAKSGRGPRENKNWRPASDKRRAVAAPERPVGLALPTSRFSSKGARRLSIQAGLVEADFVGVPFSGQQERYTIADVEAIIARKAGK